MHVVRPEVQRALAFEEVSPQKEERRSGTEESEEESEDEDSLVFMDAQKEASVSDYGVVQALLQIARRTLDTLKLDSEELRMRRLRLESAADDVGTVEGGTPGPGRRMGIKFVRYVNREEHFFSNSVGERSVASWVTATRAASSLVSWVKRMSVGRFLLPVIVPWFLCAAVWFWMRRRSRATRAL